ncbi:restriction endonuclease [Paraburkholderia kururiensis]|uniref:restriction endonuclease n=1 Tax=Paraburkholderia kururiensis TaxID=984307 RepID=UPI000F88D644|nr:restriction endonuclease [Paraburkholderia kururiensis]
MLAKKVNMFKKPSLAALIHILKTQQSSTPKMDWSELEDHVKHVYETLLNLQGEQIVVARNVQIRGKTGQSHQVDVYYEFEKAGVRHRVAIECKNTKRPIDIGKVGAFWLTIDDCHGLIGVMVSAAGYQKGAEKAAVDRGILPLSLDDLPSLSHLLGARLELYTIPDEKTIGEPFWTLFELESGKVNGSPYGSWHGNDIVSVLFFSKKQAEEFLHEHNLDKTWAVRGLNQFHLRSFIMMVDAFAGRFSIGASHIDERGKKIFGGFEISRSDLIDEFCVCGALPPEKPFVAPSRARFVRP